MNNYPSYKTTSIPWLPSIPIKWNLVKAKFLFDERVQKGYEDEPLLAATQLHGVIPKSLYENTTVTAQKDFHLLKLVEVGDFVISLRSFQGGIEYAYYKGIISPAYTIFYHKDHKQINAQYFKYFFKSQPFVDSLKLFVTGIREGQNIDYSEFKDSLLPLPSYDEQTAIANYLDAQSKKIETFISKKQKLIELLKEQKQAIINKAVTKGIDNNVKLKPSGIEWLNEIPIHWEVKKFRHFIQILNGFSPEEVNPTDSGEINYYKVDNLNNIDESLILNKSNWYINDCKKIYDKGLILIPKRGAAISTNKVAITQYPCVFDTNIMGLRIYKNADIDFLSYWLKNRNLIELTDINTIPQINNKHIYPLKIALPPILEQKLIVKFIQTQTNKIYTAISRIEKEIELIKEYKQSLIAEVVTGKMKVN